MTLPRVVILSLAPRCRLAGLRPCRGDARHARGFRVGRLARDAWGPHARGGRSAPALQPRRDPLARPWEGRVFGPRRAEARGAHGDPPRPEAEDRPDPERIDRARLAVLRGQARVRRRPPDGRGEPLDPGGVGGDRARDPGLPRPRERLDRHRLQLSRRSFRPGLRGTRWGERQERDRRPRVGFNTGSVGVAMAGTYESAGISASAKEALVSLLAWRLDVGHVDPLSRVCRVSLGSPRYAAGQTVTLNAIGGHRDTGLTSCPGTVLYGKLGAIRNAVAVSGLPKLYDPAPSGQLGGLVCFAARLSTSRDWTVTVTNESGSVVGQGTGTGTAVDWNLELERRSVRTYFYDIRAGSGIRPASGAVGTLLPLEVERARGIAGSHDTERGRRRRHDGARVLPLRSRVRSGNSARLGGTLRRPLTWTLARDARVRVRVTRGDDGGDARRRGAPGRRADLLLRRKRSARRYRTACTGSS